MYFEEAVVAYRAALQERTRERVPLEWALTQSNLGNVLTALGHHERALYAFRLALKELPPERSPTDRRIVESKINALIRFLARANTPPRDVP